MKNHAPIVIVAGLGKYDRAVGNKDELLWHVPDDLKRFKSLTLGHPVIMGRKTFESIFKMLGKPLPGRTNIVVSRDENYSKDGVIVAHSIQSALELAKSESPIEIHVGGGVELYKQFLPLVSRLHITWFFDKKESDTFFPEFENDFEVVNESTIMKYGELKYQWVDYKRK